MIPANTITPTPIVASYQYPYELPYNPFRQVVLGGTALGDAAAGRQVKLWVVEYAYGIISVGPDNGPVELTLAVPDLLSVSLAFDSNMGVVLGWQSTTGGNLHYFDIELNSYVTKPFPTASSCRVCVDDARDFYSSQSDVIFAYTATDTLYWRQQRDKYEIDYIVGATTKKLIQIAPSTANRLQFELR